MLDLLMRYQENKITFKLITLILNGFKKLNYFLIFIHLYKYKGGILIKLQLLYQQGLYFNVWQSEEDKNVISKNINKKNKKELKAKRNENKMKNAQKVLQFTNQGSKFRLFNEYIYTANIRDAFKYLKQYPKEFKIIIQNVPNKNKKFFWNIINLLKVSEQFQNIKLVIFDSDCGQGKIQEHFEKDKRYNKLFIVKSFELVAVKQYIVENDISNLPMDDCICDVVIFIINFNGNKLFRFFGWQESQRRMDIQQN